MNYLEELGFTPDMIAEVLDNTPDKLISLLESQKKHKISKPSEFCISDGTYMKGIGVIYRTFEGLKSMSCFSKAKITLTSFLAT